MAYIELDQSILYESSHGRLLSCPNHGTNPNPVTLPRARSDRFVQITGIPRHHTPLMDVTYFLVVSLPRQR